MNFILKQNLKNKVLNNDKYSFQLKKTNFKNLRRIGYQEREYGAGVFRQDAVV